MVEIYNFMQFLCKICVRKQPFYRQTFSLLELRLAINHVRRCRLLNHQLCRRCISSVVLHSVFDACSLPTGRILSGYISRKVKISAHFLTLWLPSRAVNCPAVANNSFSQGVAVQKTRG